MKLNINKYSKAPAGKVFLIGILILVLLIPMSMVESVIRDRNNLYRAANNEIVSAWGTEQVLSGPVLTLPYMQSQSKNSNWVYTTKYRHMKPHMLTMNVNLDTQVRYRGIYRVPVYTATIHMTGHFKLSDKNAISNIEEYKLEEGIFQLPFLSTQSLTKPIKLKWNDKFIELVVNKDPESSGAAVFTGSLPEELMIQNETHKFELEMEVSGSGSIKFLSLAQQAQIEAHSNWIHPSFFGHKLPVSYEIAETGFTSNWMLNNLFIDVGNENKEIVSTNWFKQEFGFGVKLIQPVDTYQLVMRAAKYAILFLGFTFLMYFIIEIISKVTLHPVQYLLVGFANCIFYLLLLSLAEHISFNLSYLVSAACSILLITLYSFGIIKDKIKIMCLFTILSALYIYLFVTLKSQDYALLFGSTGLFSTLAVVMYLTRHIDWHQKGES